MRNVASLAPSLIKNSIQNVKQSLQICKYFRHTHLLFVGSVPRINCLLAIVPFVEFRDASALRMLAPKNSKLKVK